MRIQRLCAVTVLFFAACTETHVLDDTRASTVGSGGGEAKSADELLTLTFPEDALGGETEITVGVRRDVVIAGLITSVYELGPAGLEFDVPVTIALNVGNAAATDRIVLANADGSAPVPVQGSTFYAADGLLRAELGHFSSYGGFAIDDETGECFEPVFSPEHPHFSRYEGAGEPNACASDGDCVLGGCSDEVCSANPEAITTCEIAPPPPGGSCLCVAGACRWARACEGELGACERDRDCDEGFRCEDGACRSVGGVDADGDGVTVARDCDDHDPMVFPWAPEQCDGRDNDCNGIVDEGCGTGCGDDTECPRCHVCVGDGACVATSCPDPDPVPCAYDADCRDSERCIDGRCRPDLGDRPHCTEGGCEDGALFCFRADGTVETFDCSAFGGHCTFVGPDVGFACAPGDPPPPCTTDSDCPADAACIGGRCRPSLCSLPESDPNFGRYEGVGYANDCAADSDCVASGCSGEVCAAEAVFSTCEDFGFGPDGSIPGLPSDMRCQCVHAQCQWLGACAAECNYHEDCAWGSACREGTCRPCPMVERPSCEGGEIVEEYFGHGCSRPFCACGPGQYYDPAIGGCSDGGCDASTGVDCGGGGRALCAETGGEWDPWACGHYECGRPNVCDAIIPGCNCGEGRVFLEFHGCVESAECWGGCDDPSDDGTCPRQDEELCWGSGGGWDPNSCGHWVCGESPMCDALIPGCNCGDGRVFVPGAGCRRSEECACDASTGADCNTDREVCWATGGDWDPYACGHYECGYPLACFAADGSEDASILPGDGGCNCGGDSYFQPGEGCVRSERCEGGCDPDATGMCSEDPQLCSNSGGTWYEHGCGHAYCGVPREECFADQAGCNCGAHGNFVPGLGCVEDAACGCDDPDGCETSPERLCSGTGGTWHELVCGHFVCGESHIECFVAQDGCDCGAQANYREGEGCVFDESCGGGCDADAAFACPEAYECIDGSCVLTCFEGDTDSAGSDADSAGFAADPARPTGPCPDGFVCEGGLCQKVCSCSADVNCPGDQVCVDCACVEPSCTLVPGSDGYDRFEAPEADNACNTNEDCVQTGCSGEVCAADSVFTTCEAVELPDMRCGCVDGQCIWHGECAVTGSPE